MMPAAVQGENSISWGLAGGIAAIGAAVGAGAAMSAADAPYLPMLRYTADYSSAMLALALIAPVTPALRPRAESLLLGFAGAHFVHLAGIFLLAAERRDLQMLVSPAGILVYLALALIAARILSGRSLEAFSPRMRAAERVALGFIVLAFLGATGGAAYSGRPLAAIAFVLLLAAAAGRLLAALYTRRRATAHSSAHA